MKKSKLLNSLFYNFKFLILNSRRGGFTLIELVVVFFLISLILSLSAVYFANILPSGRFDATVRELSATIRHARSLSKISGEGKTVTIDLDSGRYGIEGYGERDIPSDIDIRIKDPLSGEISTGRYRLVLNAAGDISEGTIVLQHKKKRVDIEIDPVIGAVAVK